jgi:hypothetical protein
MADVRGSGMSTPLGQSDDPDIRLWADLMSADSMTAVSIVDRMGLIEMPFKFKIYEPFRMPTDLTGFTMSYEDCCQARAQELLDLSDRLNKPLYVCYSGGIDSTAMLVAFIKQRPVEQLRKQLFVVMTPDSITEYQLFYKQFIRDKLPMVSAERLSTFFDGTKIIVGGEHNDQLFGTDVIDKVVRKFDIDTVFEKHSRDFLVPYLTSYGTSESSANWWYDMLAWHASKAPCEVTSNFDLMWWFNFCFRWQTVYFRMLLRIDNHLRPLVNDQFIQDHFHHFFSTTNFQKWSMLNPQLKIRNNNWNDYKYHAKDVIYNFTQDPVYRDNKVKVRSLFRLFLAKDTPEGLSANYEYLYNIDRQEFYNNENSFKQNYGT